MRTLLERGAELREAERFVAGVAGGSSSAALIQGVPGIGKTVLLEAVADSARDRGLRVLRARAHELEQDLPWGLMVQLLGDVAAGMAADDPAVAGPARHALTVLGREGSRPGSTGQLDALQGLLWFCTNLAEVQPLLLCVDDLPWSDTESLRSLHYVLRRVEGMPLGLVATARSGDLPGSLELAALVAECGVVLSPRPLTPEGASAAVEAWSGQQPTDSFVAACVTATSGNPLFLRELTLALTGQGVCLDDSGAARVPGIHVTSVAQAVLRRLERLPAPALVLARAFAVLSRAAPIALAADLADLDEVAAVELTVHLQKADVLTDTLLPEVTHPLLATALYESLPLVARGELHRRAAQLLADNRAGAEEVGRHVMAAPALQDASWVDVLIEAAQVSAGRGAPGAAIRYLRRALEMAPDITRHWPLVVDLGTLEVRNAQVDGEERLRTVVQSDAPPDLRALAALTLADHLAFAGRGHELADLITDQLLGAVDADLRLRLLAATVPGRFLGGLEVPVYDQFGPSEEPTLGEREYIASLAAVAGTAEEVIRCSERAVSGLDALPDALEHSASLFFVVSRLILCDRLDVAEQVLVRTEHAARRSGSVFELGRGHYLRALLATSRGDLPGAEAECEIGLELVGEAGLTVWGLARAAATSTLVEVLAKRGDLVRAADLVSAWPASETSWHLGRAMLTAAQARVDAAAGRLADAVLGLESLEPAAGALPLEMMYLRVRPTLAPLLAAAGHQERAEATADRALMDAKAWGLTRSLAAATMAYGLVVGADDGIEALRQAVGLYAGSSGMYDEALALVELGAALRRAKHLADAREPLQAGMDLAARCGAAPLAERAATELRATGMRPRRARMTGAAALTASELRVARLAVQGLGNREIAQGLFVSRKTVEKHLGSSYAKLGITTRAQLATALTQEAPQ